MTLTTRLTAFSLGALAVVLLGFSSALYLLARTYLHGQAEERLAAGLNTLVAAAEVEPDGIEWDPQERHHSVRPDAVSGPVQWVVRDEQGKRVDASLADGEDFPSGTAPGGAARPPAEEVSWDGRPWLIARRRLEAGRIVEPRPGDSPHPKRKYAALEVTAGVPLAPIRATLLRLAAALAGISLGVWLLAALVGRALCRRALVPLTDMANAARTLSAATLDQRLPHGDTGDEVSELGRAFNELLTRLQESFERQRRFTGDASHQLRTPLAAMLGQVEVALRRERPPEEYRRVLAAVQRQGLHLREIVEMMLFLSRAEAEARLPCLELVELTGWVKGHLQSWSGHPRAADIRLVETDRSFNVQVHAPLLGQLVDNLLENACKYSEPGTAVRVRLGSEPGTIRLSVEDEGTGIAPEDLPHIFEPFYRSAEARARGLAGVGLGLSVAERIAAAFGGRLTAASVPGKGTTITLHLPGGRENGTRLHGAAEPR